MTKKNIRTAKRWAFPIVAGAFAGLQVTDLAEELKKERANYETKRK